MNVKNTQSVGIGNSNNEICTQATKYAKGAIIGSAFVKHITNEGIQTRDTFVKKILI